MAATSLGETPEDQEELRAFLVRWCSTFVESVVRLRQYVSEREASIPTGSPVPDLLSDLLEKNDEVADRLLDLGGRLLDAAPPEIALHWDTYHSVLRADIPLDFRKLHRGLYLIPAPWSRPELDLFIRSVLETAKYKGSADPSKLTLLLTGEYNFSDILIGPGHPDRELVPGVIVEELFAKASVAGRGFLAIPAVERENPVIWPNLVHELGHHIGAIDEIVQRARSLPSVTKLDKHAHPDMRNHLRDDYVPEIVADLIATDLLGVGYYASFLVFATYWSRKSAHACHLTHPPVEARRQYISQRLRDLKKLSDTFEDELNRDYDMRRALDTQDPTVRGDTQDGRQSPLSATSGVNWERELKEVARDILALPEYEALISSPGGSADTESLRQQAEELARGWLVTSKPVQRESPSVEEVQKHIEQYKRKLVQPLNDVRDIITAASLAKLRIGSTRRSIPPAGATVDPFEDDLLHRFCRSPHTSTRKRLIALWEDIHRFDVAVTMSIEGAQVVRFYRASRAHSEAVRQ